MFKKEFKTNKENTAVEVRLYYDKENDFNKGRGYYCSFSVVAKEKSLFTDFNYTLRTYTPGAGLTIFCGVVQRKSAKNEKSATDYITKNLDYYLDKVLTKNNLQLVK